MSTKQNRGIFDKLDSFIEEGKRGPQIWGIKLDADEQELVQEQGKNEKDYSEDFGMYRHYLISYSDEPLECSPQWERITKDQMFQTNWKIATKDQEEPKSIQKVFGILSIEHEMSFKFFSTYEKAFEYLKKNYKYDGENYVRFDGLECGIVEYKVDEEI